MRATLSHASAFVVLLAGLASASARVTTVRIDRVEPFANGMSFGDSGAYERVIGIARGELDPADPRNRVIVGIDRAPRNAAGMVEYETDLFILRPVDPAKGNRQLLFDVVNRGNKVVTNALEQRPRRRRQHQRSVDASMPATGSCSVAATPSPGLAGIRTRRRPTRA